MSSLDARRKGVIRKPATDKGVYLRTSANGNCRLPRACFSPSSSSSSLILSSIMLVLFCHTAVIPALPLFSHNAGFFFFFKSYKSPTGDCRLSGQVKVEREWSSFPIALAGGWVLVMEIGAFKCISALKLY